MINEISSFVYNLISRSAIVLIVALLSVNYLPKQLFQDFPFEPRSVEAPKFETVIPKDWNTKLSGAGQPEYIQLNNILGPESIAISPVNDKLLYTGLADGRIVELDAGRNYKIRQVLRFNQQLTKCKDNVPYEATDCGRFLQLRYQNTTLYAAEANTGLYKIDPSKGTKTLVGPKVKLQPVNLFNSFAFDPKEPNIVYITVSSTKWDLTQIFWSIIELEPSGQVIALDVNTGKRVILMDKLSLPNGIDVDTKRDELIFSELAKSRVNSLCLKEVRRLFHRTKDGEKIQDNIKLTELIPLLPGMPDNIHIKDDLAYIALPFVRINGSELLDNLSDAPMLRKSFGRMIFGVGKILEYVCKNFYHHPSLEMAYHELKSGHFNYRVTQSDRSAILEYNLASGSSRILGSDKFGFLSEALPDGKGNLLLGSFRSPFIVKTKLI